MSTVYLYVKQHSVTGLKYFGKTTKDPYVYKGSGKYWLNHVRKHGKEHIITLEVWSFSDIKSCTSFASNFSSENNIVESNEWANLAPENGTDGGYRLNNHFKKYNQLPKTAVHINKVSKALTGNKNACKSIKIDNVIYSSKVEAAKVYNVTPNALLYWVKIGKAFHV